MTSSHHLDEAPADHATHPAMVRHCDVAVIGGAAAGLAAALQLVRQRRSVIVIDDGSPRNAPASHMHGYLGHEGLAPSELVRIGREEVRSFGGEVLTGRVLAVRPTGDGHFHLDLSGGHGLVARRVVAASGIVDELPAIGGLAEQWGRGVVNCPFCHGFEVRDRRLVQIVTHPMGLHQAPVWRHLCAQLTIVLHAPAGIDDDATRDLESAGVVVVRDTVRSIVAGPDGELEGVELATGRVLPADAVVVGTRFRARADVLAGAGVSTNEHVSGLGDAVEVDPATGQTGVTGIYAAGNLADPSLQVLPAAAQGSRVGALVALDLAADDLRAGVRSSGDQVDWDHRYGGDEAVWSRNPNGTLVGQASALRPARALDVGAGEGADALWLAEQGWQVTASDISGNALARVRREAERRGVAVRTLQRDVNDLDAFGAETYDLVSLQYGSFRRTPDRRGVSNLLDAVAPGGTLLVVGHDRSPLSAPVDVSTQTRMYDHEAYVGVDEIAAALTASGDWHVDVHETRPRPPGAASTQHVADVVLQATRRTQDER